MEEQHEEARELMENARETFKEQFGVELNPTGHEMTEEEADGVMYEEEFWVNGLIESPLQFEVGGWFRVDTRHAPGTVSVQLSVKLDGENVHEDYALQSWFNLETQEWEDLELRGL